MIEIYGLPIFDEYSDECRIDFSDKKSIVSFVSDRQSFHDEDIDQKTCYMENLMNSNHQPYNGYKFGSHYFLKVEDDVFSPISKSDFQIVSLSAKKYEVGRLFQE